MPHHKRKRPKNRRGGCLLCKDWKANHSPILERWTPSERREIEGAELAIAEEIQVFYHGEDFLPDDWWHGNCSCPECTDSHMYIFWDDEEAALIFEQGLGDEILDSPNWMNHIIEKLADRKFRRINDPRMARR